MKFKEFENWCNERASDGCWDMYDAMLCITIINEVNKVPFWKRKKYWEEKLEKDVTEGLVKPIEQKISELKQRRKDK